MLDQLFANVLEDTTLHHKQTYSELYCEHQEALKALKYSLEVIDELQKVVARQNKRIEFLINNMVLSEEE